MKYINDEENFVPDNSIVFYPKDKQKAEKNNWKIEDIVESLIGQQQRDYFKEHAYLCLPLTIANQYGFVVKANMDFTLFHPGKEAPVLIDLNGKQLSETDAYLQNYFTNFKSGILSIENAFHLRTPPGINLMTIQPSNYFIPGLHVMSGVVETDNLRRSFTFNLKVTTPGVKIHVKKGDWLSAFIPVPRYFVDGFELLNGDAFFDEGTMNLERASIAKARYERNIGDFKDNSEKGIENPILLGAGRKYFKGIHPNDELFKDHQKRISPKIKNDGIMEEGEL